MVFEQFKHSCYARAYFCLSYKTVFYHTKIYWGSEL